MIQRLPLQDIAKSISNLFMKAITYNEQTWRCNDDEIVLLTEFHPVLTKPEYGDDCSWKPAGRASRFLTSYFTTTSSYAGKILHAIFSTHQGIRTEFPAYKLDACHALLGLAPNQALVEQVHNAWNTLRRWAASSVVLLMVTRTSSTSKH